MEPLLRRRQKMRWFIWGILCFAYIVGFLHRLALGTVKDDLTGAFHLSATGFANLSSAYFYAYLVMQIPAGMLLDTIGARKTVMGGAFLAGIGSVLFGLAPSAAAAFASRLLVGVGASVIYVAILKVLTEWFFEREFATLSGLTTLVGNLGAILSQTPLLIVVAFLSWRNTFVLIGAASLLAAVCCFFFVKDRPDEMGLPAVRETERGKAEKIGIVPGLIAICRNPRTWPPFFFFAAFYGTFQALAGTWGQSYLVKVYGMGGVAAANLMIFAIAGMAVGSVAVGKFSDLLERRRLPMKIVGAVNLSAWGIMVLANGGKPPINWLPWLLFILGLSSAAYITCWASGKEVNDPRHAGTSIALINAGGFVGAAFVPVVLGGVIDLYGNRLPMQALYQRAFLVCLVCAVIGWGLGFLVKETNCRNIHHERH